MYHFEIFLEVLYVTTCRVFPPGEEQTCLDQWHGFDKLAIVAEILVKGYIN
jgi:hypothetical protein